MKTECHEEDVQSYRKTDYKPGILLYTSLHCIRIYLFSFNTIRTGNVVYDV